MCSSSGCCCRRCSCCSYTCRLVVVRLLIVGHNCVTCHVIIMHVNVELSTLLPAGAVMHGVFIMPF